MFLLEQLWNREDSDREIAPAARETARRDAEQSGGKAKESLINGRQYRWPCPRALSDLPLW